MADEHHADALIAHPLDEIEDVLGLDDAECSRWLIEEDDLVRPGCGAGNGNALPLAARHVAHRLGEGSHGGTEILEGLGAPLPHLLAVHESQQAEDAVGLDLTAQEQVVHGIEMRAQRKVLIDGLDPPCPGLGWGMEVHVLAKELDAALLRLLGTGEHLRERALAGPVVTDERGHLAGFDIEVAAVEGHDLAVGADDAARLKKWHAVHPSLVDPHRHLRPNR
ncbi:unannotated protein [freshwater metagenome]|uniref:Unannotated protein n=1 Tax=freshwater metagenome TaxID=449393 RepID=A0A6J7CR93_9ZZZZ